jgi:hypothetical protein
LAQSTQSGNHGRGTAVSVVILLPGLALTEVGLVRLVLVGIFVWNLD